MNFIAQNPPSSGSAPDFSTFATGDPVQIQMIGHEFVHSPELQPAAAYAKRLSLGANEGSGKGHIFINGKHFNYDDVSYFNEMQ